MWSAEFFTCLLTLNFMIYGIVLFDVIRNNHFISSFTLFYLDTIFNRVFNRYCFNFNGVLYFLAYFFLFSFLLIFFKEISCDFSWRLPQEKWSCKKMKNNVLFLTDASYLQMPSCWWNKLFKFFLDLAQRHQTSPEMLRVNAQTTRIASYDFSHTHLIQRCERDK